MSYNDDGTYNSDPNANLNTYQTATTTSSASGSPNVSGSGAIDGSSLQAADAAFQYLSGGTNVNPVSSSNKNNNTGNIVTNSSAGYSTNSGAGDAYSSSQQLSVNGGARAAGFLSEIETNILRSNVPISVQESEEITVSGQRGVWTNRAEVEQWRGQIPINQYLINEDQNPEIVNKRTQEQLTYVQELAIRYLRPPTPPAPGEIVITQEANTATAPAPPVIIRQAPARPSTPEPLVVREAPPQPPSTVGRKVITISGKRLPPPPRKVVIERLAALPSKPQSVIIERWLPYSDVKRRVIFNRSTQADPVVVKPRNVIVQWEAPQVVIKKEVKYLGTIRANPVEYVQRYGATLKTSRELPEFVTDIRTPDGLVLAANHTNNTVHELEGDLDAFRFVDLDREGLTEYRNQLERLSIRYSASAASIGNGNGGAAYGSSTVSSGNQSQQFITELFSQFDRDGSGSVAVAEAQTLLLRLNSRLGRSYGEAEAREFFARLDRNGDGLINLQEFRAAFERI